MKSTGTLRDLVQDVAAYLRYEAEEGDVPVTAEVLSRLEALQVRSRTAGVAGGGGAVPAAAPARPAKRAVAEPAVPAREPVAAVVGAPAAGGAEAELARIAAAVARCTKCGLHKGRTRTVPGQGAVRPEILFVGEGPGEEEDRQGLAFVGAAGQLLRRLIRNAGLREEEVFIANVVKCRPPGNRQPAPDEMAACLPYLREQIAALRPKVIVTLGGVAVQGLMGVTAGVTRLRGKWLSYEGTDLMPTFHPSYLLRSPSERWKTWDDMKAVLERLGRPAPAAPDRQAAEEV